MAVARRRDLLCAAAALLGASARPARAQGGWPDRPIRLIVPFPPGGGLDIVARLMAEAMRPRLGQPVLVENRSGAGGQIGTQAVAKAPGDGYTLLCCTAGEIAVAPHLHGDRLPYDPVQELAPITLLVRIPNLLVVGAGFPARSMAELVAQARVQPDRLTYATGGIGNIQHLNGELLNRMAGIRLVHAPYRGTAQSMTDVASGRVTMTFAGAASMLPLIQDGRLRPLGVTSRTRLPSLPEVPTLSEEPALAGYELENWFALFAPGTTPGPVVARLNAVATEVLRDPEIERKLAEQGAQAAPMTPSAFRDFIAQESAKLGRIVRDARITPEG